MGLLEEDWTNLKTYLFVFHLNAKINLLVYKKNKNKNKTQI
jgi:hypothetical protein